MSKAKLTPPRRTERIANVSAIALLRGHFCRQGIAQAAEKAGRIRDLLARDGIDRPTITEAGTGSFEFEAARGVYTELQRGSCIFMDAAD